MKDFPNLTIELVWEDKELEELLVSAYNGRYSGASSVYFAQGDVQRLANLIRGFPKTTSQLETFIGGNETDYPFAELVFRCADGAGHPTVHVSLAETVYHNGRPLTENRVELELPCEAAALDSFCEELDQVAHRQTNRAVLRGLAA